MQGSPDAKKPCKGILKTSSSFDKHSGASHRKSAKFDEINVLQTYHPPDKDYGHMKIEEPKTPFNYVDPDEGSGDQLDAELLAKKLAMAANTRTSSFEGDEASSDEDLDETEEEKVKRIEFEKRRKAHYNEFAAVKLARKLIEEEDDDEDEIDTNKNGNNSKSDKPSGSGNRSGSKKMEIEDDREDAQNTSPCSDN